MSKSDVITLLILAALIAAVIFGKRAGRAQLASALSAARAEGHATATTELRAQLTQAVSVNVTPSSDVSGPITEDGIRDVLTALEVAAIRHALTVPIGSANVVGPGDRVEPPWVDSRERSRLIRAVRSDRTLDRGSAAALNVGSRPTQEIAR